MSRIFIVVWFLLFCNTDVYALTGREIIESSDRIMQGDSQITLGEITIKARKWTRTMRTGSYMVRKGNRTFFEILSPKKDAGNRFLLLDSLMWHYVPKLGQTIKISPSMMLQSWMGSDFTHDDIVKESSLVLDYDHRLSGAVKVSGYDCHRVEMLPKKDAIVVWGKMVYFARSSDMLPVRVEYYNEHEVMKKVLNYSDFKKMDDRVIPTKMHMQTVGKKDRYTIMLIKKIRFDENIPDSVFSIRNIKRK